ncbi:MAG: PfkB family carbohydrate kinase [Microbacterium sp.]
MPEVAGSSSRSLSPVLSLSKHLSKRDDPVPSAEVLVFGDLIDDIVVVPDGAIRPDTDTPSRVELRPGGSAANTAAWLAADGVATVFIGRCGPTDVGRHTALLAPVDARLEPDDLGTGSIVILVEGERRSMLTQRGANVNVDPAAIDPAGFSLVHATGYTVAEHPDAFADFVERAHAAGVRVSLNAGSVAAIEALGAAVFLRAIAGVDILVASEAEAALLDGATFDLTVVTAGRRGATVFHSGEATHVPSRRTETIDPTGAGDAFTAGLLSGVLRGLTPVDAAIHGTELAAQVVRQLGARPPQS